MSPPRGWARWDHIEDEAILAGEATAEELAVRFGRSAQAVRTRHMHLRELGRTPPAGERRPWTAEEDELISGPAGNLRAVAVALGRTYAALRTRRSWLRGNRRPCL